MKVFIRADGGSKIGLGHIMRMLVLAKELSKRNEVIFLCKSSKIKIIRGNNTNETILNYDEFKAGIEKVKENGFKVLRLNVENVVEDIIKLQNIYRANLIITDSYDVDEKYFDELKPYFNLTGYVDDVNTGKKNIDFIINQNINAFDIDYTSTINSNTKLFLGTKYCMLREEFRDEYKKKEIRNTVNNILLTLGGMDENHNTVKVLDEIKLCGKDIHVAIGNAFNKDVIEKIYDISKYYSNIKVYENANMSSLMKICDIAISACGSTLYELCAMKVPSIGLIIANNQEQVARKMKAESIIFEAYWINEIKKYNLTKVLDQLINDKKLRLDIIANQSKLINIDGVKTLVDEINNLI